MVVAKPAGIEYRLGVVLLGRAFMGRIAGLRSVLVVGGHHWC